MRGLLDLNADYVSIGINTSVVLFLCKCNLGCYNHGRQDEEPVVLNFCTPEHQDAFDQLLGIEH